MKRRQPFCLYLGLILSALCSCDKNVQNVTETDDAMAKVRRRAATMFQPSELGNFYVNPDLDLESEAIVLEELISYGFLENNEQVEITPIYSEDIIPAFFKSLIVEPESNEWYDINADEVMNMYKEFPSIAFYVINSESGKSFFTTADKRFATNLIAYRSPGYLDPDIMTIQAEVINDLYDSGASIPFAEWKSEVGARLSDILNDIYCLKVCYWQFELCKADCVPWPDCQFVSSGDIGPFLSEDMRWGQSDIFGDCDSYDEITGSIVLSILKILCYTNYSGLLLGESFDGSAYYNNMNVLNSFALRLYNIIESSDVSKTEQGLAILSECGYNVWYNPMTCVPFSAYGAMSEGKVVIDARRDGGWSIVDGCQYTKTTCSTTYMYDYDRNECEGSYANWESKSPFSEIYLSYEN